MLSARPISIHMDGPSQAPAKTPGRTLPKGRNALQENALYRAALPATAKARKVATHHTPFHTKSTTTSKTASNSILTNLAKTASKPLFDKTPFRNRAGHTLSTPHTAVNKIQKLSFLDPELEIPSQVANLRPSSARKSLRLPRPSGSATSNKFRTPVTTGNHWDVSDGEVEVQGAKEEAEKEAMEVEDDDEIEYMPPTAIIPPYEPPFELPDYKELGKALMRAAYSHPYDDRPPPQLDLSIYDEKFFAATEASLELELPELEDDNLFLPAPTPTVVRDSTSTTSSSTLPSRTTRSTINSSSDAAAPTTAKSTLPSRRPTTRAVTRSAKPQVTTSDSRSIAGAKPALAQTRAASVTSTRSTTRLRAAVPRPATTVASSSSSRTRATSNVASAAKPASTLPRRTTRTAIAAKETSEPVAANDVENLLLFDGQDLGGLDDDFLFDV
ncbi:hypothetical protein NEOLEDRAFT_697030 [Neolentinus lepideus HHB14362 ss-1]|uniref:Uncharacterized protein n=1 Tax=Neolentinus lepideus HHB14362 ss-1 TaxID=1314782 RepID=A0A165V2V6_9AGAM|nr:hypothetical protein NEOLEDRAFT_697030 [Neolentinus lepideus HHB14362 ss-1]